MTKQRILTLITIIALGIGGYNIYKFMQKTPGTESDGTAKTILQKDLSRFANLKNPKLDISIFQDPAYKILEYTPGGASAPTSPSAAGTGRSNPFLPF